MELINPIFILIFIDFLLGWFFLNKKEKINLLLISVLSVSLFLEILSIYLLLHKNNLNFLYSIGFLIHNVLWLLILTNSFKKSNYNYITVLYVVFGICNYFFIEKDKLNYLTFIAGALLYILIFLFESFKKLAQENLSFFNLNAFLLIIAPILFFLGFSLLLGFRDSYLFYEKVFLNITLYIFIMYFVNIFYYLIIFIYIIKSREIYAK